MDDFVWPVNSVLSVQVALGRTKAPQPWVKGTDSRDPGTDPNSVWLLTGYLLTPWCTCLLSCEEETVFVPVIFIRTDV